MVNTKYIQKSTKRKTSLNHNTTYSNQEQLVKRKIFGIGITNATTVEVLEYLLKIIQNSQKNLYVVTPNPEIIVLSQQKKEFQDILNRADLALCDGIQLFRAARFLGQPLKERIIGTDFMEKVCEKVQDWPITVGFLGGGPKVAEETSECLSKKFPGLKVVFVGTEWDKDSIALGEKYLVSSISYIAQNGKLKSQNTKYQIPNTDIIDVLFVAFGFPKQEEWMQKHLNTIPVRVMIGVGGAFDQIVNPSLRPPRWMHTIGLGWLYRLTREPWRIKRQLKLIEFIRLVLREKYLH